MSETFSFLAAPFTLAALLVLIHAYLGLHVLERGVIFVDISLSQVAALGSALAALYFPLNEPAALACALFLCLLTALFLALLQRWEKKLSQEVIIGITYALATGIMILVADKLPHGAEQIKQALIGNILFATWPHTLETLAVYLLVGIIHFIFRKQFWLSSCGKLNSFLWDFLFYLLFGVVITFSTHHAGVLVVFSILVVPSALAIKFTDSAGRRLAFSWMLGILGIFLAFCLSYWLDWPIGAAIVTTLTLGFFLILVIKLFKEQLAKNANQGMQT